MESVRQQKIAKLIQKELAEIFRANSKSMFEGAFITVTIVRVSPDLGYAKVYLSIMANQNADVVFEHINLQKTHIRKLLGMQIGKQVRVIPELSFFIDDSYDYAEKINQLLNKPI
jgi:ribosome-binding factor A